MSKIIIINASKKFFHSNGALNDHLSHQAEQVLRSLGHEVQTTRLEDGYQVSEEIQKYLWADAIIYQMPAWWMEGPWTLKKYIDEVFTEGHGLLYEGDGRSRSDLSKKYGSGGLLQGKHYMLSVTWNAPTEAFSDPAQFFEGKGVDAVYYPFHKANMFLGLSPLPTFMCNDVMKDPEVEQYTQSFQEHLKQVFNK